jgi:hypothetical protein
MKKANYKRYLKHHPNAQDKKIRTCNILYEWVFSHWKDISQHTAVKHKFVEFVDQVVVKKDKLAVGQDLLQILASKLVISMI